MREYILRNIMLGTIKTASRVAWLIAVCALASEAATALDRDRTLGQFYHTGWTVKDGAPGQISTLAQTADGYIWIAAAATLYRFDGVRFERFEPTSGPPLPNGAASALLPLADGSLWIGFQFGGASLLKDDKLTNYNDQDGMPIGTVYDFAVDGEGTVWAATPKGLVRRDGERWRMIGAEWNYPAKDAKSLFVDRDGVLWVATGETLVFLPPHEKKFRETGRRFGWILTMAQAPDGTLWGSDVSGSVQTLASPGGGAPLHSPKIDVQSAGVLFDRDGALWIGALGEGLRRVPYPERLADRHVERFDTAAEIFTHQDGLTADYVWPVLQDREGNIWFGTSGGLDRFRPSNLVLGEFPTGSHDLALVADTQGAIWAGTTNRPLMKLKGNTVTTQEAAERVMSAYRDTDGIIWLGNKQGIWRIENDQPVLAFPPPDGVTDSDVQAITRDRSGAFWISISTHGLYRRANDAWTRVDLSALKVTTPLIALTDAGGRLWFGATRNRILRVDGEDMSVLSEKEGLDVGNVTALVQGAERIWTGGERGLAYFDGAGFRTLALDGAESLRGVVGIIEMSDGDLWIHAIPGVFHLAADEVAKAVADSKYRMRYELFDFLDGLPARPTQLRPLPTAIRATDGRLWFATSNGAAWIDPHRVQRNALAPPVSIESLTAAGHSYPLSPDLTLPEGTTSVQIDYTALSLSIPERVRFRYRLQDSEDDWQDAGTRRQAIYTNLGPGQHRFHVIAANNDGVWNEAGATLDFAIAPAYYQTHWFRVLCVIGALVLVWLVYLLRLRQMTARVRDRLEQRHIERERIARELHDTLLQSIQGLILRFQAVAEQIPERDPVRSALDSALDRADEVLGEGRDRVRDLRVPIDSIDDLSRAMSDVVEKLAADNTATFRLVVEGEAQSLDPSVADEIFRIGREALINAFQHSRANAIETEIAFEPDALRLRVRDDGVGIGEEILDAGGRSGHWGLPGMRERALKIGAQLKVWGGPRSGTEIELWIPAKVAYARDNEKSWRQWLRRLAGAGR